MDLAVSAASRLCGRAVPSHYPPEAGFELAVAAMGFRNGVTTVAQLVAVVDRTVLYAVRPELPGLLVFTAADDSWWLLAFSDITGLARFATSRCDVGPLDWISTTGADLIDQLPPHVGLVVDPGEGHAIALPPEWLARQRPRLDDAATTADQIRPRRES
jgi:hypothetical protein